MFLFDNIYYLIQYIICSHFFLSRLVMQGEVGTNVGTIICGFVRNAKEVGRVKSCYLYSDTMT